MVSVYSVVKTMENGKENPVAKMLLQMLSIGAEMENNQKKNRQYEGIQLASMLPKWYLKFVFRRFSKNAFKIKQRFGTTYVTSVSGFADVSGFAIPYIEGGNRPISFAIGSIVKKPGVINSEIKIREYMNLTICINHDLVDGAPAARFVSRLKQRIEGYLIS